MKAIMYHYVRPDEPGLPYFRHLHIDEFVKQLDYFENKFGFVSREEFQNSITFNQPARGVVLTFDDGFKDHIHYVLPELLKRNLWGIFYIPTSPCQAGNMIDVHRIHMLIGKHGGNAIAEAINDIISEDMLSQTHVEEFRTKVYTTQNNDENTAYVKSLLNYFIDYKYREGVLDKLMSIFYPNQEKLVQEFYMTRDELAHMHNNGMLLGSHSVNHPVMSKLALEEQETEIVLSFKMIESITGQLAIKSFCYPYGGFHTFTDETENLLEKHSCHFSFNVEPRDINQNDLANRPQALPRFDCNMFPHGSCLGNTVGVNTKE